MLSKPIASGAMLVVILGALGAAAFQQQADVEQVATQVQANPARTPVASPSAAERAVGSPDRVVDTAGFPVVPERPSQDLTTGPVVTVNGRPLGTPAGSDDPNTEAPVISAEDEAPRDTAPDQDIEIAVAAPPRPLPRPEGLGTAPSETAIDYDAIAEAANGQNSGVLQPPAPQQQAVITSPLPQPEVISPPQQPSVITPPALVPGNDGLVRDPDRDELVGVVGPSGQVIWVYEEQLRETERSRVTFQNAQPQPANPFGFIYE